MINCLKKKSSSMKSLFGGQEIIKNSLIKRIVRHFVYYFHYHIDVPL